MSIIDLLKPSRPAIVALIAGALGSLALAYSASEARADTICTWGGTPAAPTGMFTVHPGITNTPASQPLYAEAVGDLGGPSGCKGQVTFAGQFDPGSTCNAFTIHGAVAGLPGVARFSGGGGVLSVDLLYDKEGNVVGSDQPSVATAANLFHATDCNTPSGFTKGQFTSDIELFGN